MSITQLMVPPLNTTTRTALGHSLGVHMFTYNEPIKFKGRTEDVVITGTCLEANFRKLCYKTRTDDSFQQWPQAGILDYRKHVESRAVRCDRCHCL